MDSKNLKAMKKNYIAPTIEVLCMNTVVILAGSNPTGTSVYKERMMILLPPNTSVFLLSLTACGMKTTFGRNKSLRAKNIQYKKLTAMIIIDFLSFQYLIK